MAEIDLYVSGDHAVLALDQIHLAPNTTLHINNDPNNPAEQIYLKAPAIPGNAQIQWHSSIDLKTGPKPDIVLLLSQNTHIYNGNFKDFDRILLTDHKIQEQSNTQIILKNNEHYNINLVIDKFFTKEGFISCNNLSLLGKGRISEILGLKLHSSNSKVILEGGDFLNITPPSVKNFLYIGKLDIRSHINALSIDRVYIDKEFEHQQINLLEVKKTKAVSNWHLSGIKEVKEFSFASDATYNKLSGQKISITNLLCPKGKFYIDAKSYINFVIETGSYKEPNKIITGVKKEGSSFRGVELVIDMSDNSLQTRVVKLPNHKFNFDRIQIIKATEVSIVNGGVCRELILQDCSYVDLVDVEANELRYNLTSGQGRLAINKNNKVASAANDYIKNILINGDVNVVLAHLEGENIEGYGLCKINFGSAIKYKSLKVNLNIDAQNSGGFIKNGDSVVRIQNDGSKAVEIDEILAKLTTFYIKGNAKLGVVIIQTIDKIDTQLWVDMQRGTILSLKGLFVGFDHDLQVLSDGTINLIKNERMITNGGQTFMSVSARSQNYVYVKAGQGIRFEGSLTVVDGDIGMFTKYKDIFISGYLKASNNISLASEHGAVQLFGATLDAKAVAIYSGTDAFLADSIIRAENIVAYVLGNYIQIKQTELTANKVVIVAGGNVNIASSRIYSNALAMRAGGNVTVNSSEIIATDIFTKAIKDFLLANSNIHLVQQPHVLFAHEASSIRVGSNNNNNNTESTIQGGIRVATDVTIVGIFGNKQGGNDLLPKLSWKLVDFNTHPTLEEGKAYIEANRGVITGSSIDAKNLQVIIKTAYSLQVVPLNIYNEVMNAGGIREQSIKEVVSRINAGLIDIDAGKAGLFVGSLLTAAIGNIKAEILHLLNSPGNIKAQQERIKAFSEWGVGQTAAALGVEVSRYFNFSQSTTIEQRLGNLGLYENYTSADLSYSKAEGNIIINRSITKYNKLYINTEGKILIMSQDLQKIYRGSGGGEGGKQAALASRTVVGGNEVYLIANEVISQAGKFEVKGDFKIITKNGVHLLPISVHERLMYHVGSKTTIEESAVRRVISEINAGYLEIRAGGAFEAVSSLIKATGMKLDVGELQLKAEYDIFTRNIHFIGKEKYYGKRNERHDYHYDAFVLPTVISTDNLYAKITGNTTLQAAQILIKEESMMYAGGNISFLPKHDIHIHDSITKKAYLMKFSGGKLSVAGAKSVREHFYGEQVAPTIYYAGGSFFAYSEGKIHLLGAKVMGKDIYLLGQKGIKLEAAPFSTQKLIHIKENGIRTGFNIGGGEVSLGAEIYQDLSKLKQAAVRYEATEVMASSHLRLESKEGELEVISSKLCFDKAQVIVRGLHMHTHQETITTEQSHTHMSAGVRVGMQENITAAVSRAGYLINKSGTHWLDILDTGLNAYQLYGETSSIIGDIRSLAGSTSASDAKDRIFNLDSVKFGAWARASARTSSNNSQNTYAVDNQIIGGDLDIQVDGRAVIEGIECQVDNFKIKAQSLSVRASQNTSVSESYSSEVNITIPISGQVSGGVGIRGNEGNSTGTYYNDNNMIIAKGQLIVDISGDAFVSGVRLEGAEVLIRAKNLVLESLQDTIKERMRGMDINIGTGSRESGAGSLGGKAEVTNRDARWSNAIASIIGTQVVNIVVEQTLEIAGGLIANAEMNIDGTLTDKGKLSVKASSLIVKTLHDYDKGKSLGLGVTLAKKTDSAGRVKYGVGMPVVCAFDDKSRDLLPVIGQGDLSIGGEPNRNIPGLSRNINQYISNQEHNRAGLRASVPVSDIADSISSFMDRVNGNASYDQGVPAAGDEDETLGDMLIEIIQNIKDFFTPSTAQANNTEVDDSENQTQEQKEEAQIEIESFNKQIFDNIKKDSLKAPVTQTQADIDALQEIKQEIKEKYPSAKGEEEKKLINLSYNIYKKYGHQDYIGARPDIELAFAGVAARFGPIGRVYLSKAIEAAKLALSSSRTASSLHKLFLVSDDAKRYEDLHEEIEEAHKLSSNNVFEKRKASNESKSRSKVKDRVGSATTSSSGMPDPDNEEPEEEKEDKQDQNKQEHKKNVKVKYKKSGYEFGDDIGVQRFTVKGKKGVMKDPKSGQYLEPEQARNSGVGPHKGYWKLKNFKGERIGTISEDGRYLGI